MPAPRQVRDVVFVDGVRTPFGKAGPNGLYAETRADDLVIKVIRELLRRHPELPPERVDEVAIAATTQIGDQGLTIGRTAALLAGLPKTVPGFAIDRMCAGAMTAVTTTASGIGFGAYDVAIAAGLNVGATGCLLAAEQTARELGLPVRMRLVGYAFAGVEPEVMGESPITSTEKALRRAGLTIDDIGLFELNEAFAVQVLAFLDHYGIADDDPRINPWGGAIAVGHPLASSGVRLMTQLARHFAEHPEVRYGLTAMCIGIGMGGTVIWENPRWEGQ